MGKRVSVLDLIHNECYSFGPVPLNGLSLEVNTAPCCVQTRLNQKYIEMRFVVVSQNPEFAHILTQVLEDVEMHVNGIVLDNSHDVYRALEEIQGFTPDFIIAEEDLFETFAQNGMFCEHTQHLSRFGPRNFKIAGMGSTRLDEDHTNEVISSLKQALSVRRRAFTRSSRLFVLPQLDPFLIGRF